MAQSALKHLVNGIVVLALFNVISAGTALIQLDHRTVLTLFANLTTFSLGWFAKVTPSSNTTILINFFQVVWVRFECGR